MNPCRMTKLYSLLSNNFSRHIISHRNEFSSAFSLKNLYPNSSLKITTPVESAINEKSTQTFSGYIPLEKVRFRYSLSSGPGGQHANKTYTKVQLRIQLSNADWIPEKVRQKLLEIKKNQLTKDGHLVIQSDKTRSQYMNKADVLQRLRCIIYHAVEESTPSEPTPETIDMIRKRQEKANRERLRIKRVHSSIKESRRNVD